MKNNIRSIAREIERCQIRINHGQNIEKNQQKILDLSDGLELTDMVAIDDYIQSRGKTRI